MKGLRFLAHAYGLWVAYAIGRLAADFGELQAAYTIDASLILSGVVLLAGPFALGYFTGKGDPNA